MGPSVACFAAFTASSTLLRYLHRYRNSPWDILMPHVQVKACPQDYISRLCISTTLSRKDSKLIF